MDNFPEIVNFKLTSKCNHNCQYCYDSKKHDDMNLEELRKMIKLLHKNGVKGIVLGGGEPLVREDISEILKEIARYDIKIYLDTNGDFLFKYKEDINRFVATLGLPLDYSSNLFSYRNSQNFNNIISILEYYSKLRKRPRIRIGTVVTKENVNDLKNIANLLKDYNIDLWKIYQFIPIGPNALSNQDKLLINLQDFEKAVNPIKKQYSKYFKILISSRKSRVCAYFFISSDGTVFMPRDDSGYKGDMDIGNIFDKDIAKKWKEYVNKKNYIKNAESTLNHKFSPAQ